MASTPYADGDADATVRAPAEAAVPPAPPEVDDEATRVVSKSSPVPVPAPPPAAFVAQGNDVDPEATNIKPSVPSADEVEATSIDRGKPRHVPAPPLPRASLPRRLVRRFTGEMRIPGAPREKPGFLFFSTVAVLAVSLLIGIFQVAAWLLRSPEGPAAQAQGLPAPEERGVLDKLIHW